MENKTEREFIMHYNIQRLVQQNQQNRRYRPMDDGKKHLVRMRSKTVYVGLDDIDVKFAIDQLSHMENGDGIYVRVNLGVSVVNPGDPKLYKKLKSLLKAAEKEKANRGPDGGGFPPAENIKAKMEKFKPDHYSRKGGAAKAKEVAGPVNLHLLKATVKPGKVTLRLEHTAEGLVIDYVKDLKSGSIRLHLVEVDGMKARTMIAYSK